MSCNHRPSTCSHCHECDAAEARREVLAMLRELEWASGGGFGPSADDQEYRDVACYFCDGRRDEHKTRGGYVIKSGHEPDCKLAAMLRHSEGQE